MKFFRKKAFTPVKWAMPNRQGRYLTGFTLIELLITISIIGILATVVILNLSGARYRSNYTKVLSDMKAIEGSARLYHDENKAWPVESADAYSTTEIAVYLAAMPVPPCTGYYYEYKNIAAASPSTDKYIGVNYMKSAISPSTDSKIFYLSIDNFSSQAGSAKAIDTLSPQRVTCNE